jgi:alkanesulfonate monooxygenase SsuD/methylene tetrahydromethanopterin reductase-like flavin-dependent oxidoreductase (luciferase family)
VAGAFASCDDICLAAWRFPDLETTADEVRAEAAEAGRDPATLGVAALLPVSIGRTRAEADARVAIDPLLGRLGHPAETGIFGTLEECQDRVIALAHAGISDLRCVLPATSDVHDVLAQLTAMTVGTTEVLVPGSLRSPAPPPPDGWGGRADLPTRPQVSAGSRRR